MRTIAPAALLLAAVLAACAESPTEPLPEAEEIAVAPQCSQPAPLAGTLDPRVGESYIVVYHDSVASVPTTARLGDRYGFQPRHVYQYALQGFAASLTRDAVAGIRCEPEVKYVNYEAMFTIDW